MSVTYESLLSFIKFIRALPIEADRTPYEGLEDALEAIKRCCTPEESHTIDGILSGRWNIQIAPPVITEEQTDAQLVAEILRLFDLIEDPTYKHRVLVNISQSLNPA